MKHPREYLKEIEENVQKMRAQGQVTPAENALFGMIDGLAGLNLGMLNQIADLTVRLERLEGKRQP